MKRRAALAGLLAVAISALVAILVGSGGGGQGTKVIKGQPYTGDRGVTRSVASIKALQRYRDRHPEIERRRTAVLAAEEAAREEAARESGEPAEEEEGEAGEPNGEGPPAATAEADTDIREKPEPGGEEQGLPPKQSGPSSRQQRVGRAAITPSQAVTSSTNFLGADSEEAHFVPPDSMGSVGPTQILVAVNGKVKVFNKDGTPGALDVSDAAFWASVRNGSEPTDPGVEYDRLSQRWIVSAINTEDSNNRIMLAVSDGPTITSTSDFTYFFFNQAVPPPSASPRFADYPQLGVDANAIYIGVNEFAAAPATGFLGTTVYVIRKSSVLGVGPIFVTAFRNLISGSPSVGPVSPQPATDMLPSIDSGYIVGPDASFFSRLDVRRISDPGGTPSISGNLVVPVPQTFVPTTTPFSVPAQGTFGGLDALDDRLFEAMIGREPDGDDTLWTAHNLRMNAAGVSSSSGDRVGGRWYQLGNLGTNPPSLIQSGTLFDPAGSNPRQFWIPTIAMNGQGHASINSSAAGVTQHAEVASSGRLFTDPLGTIEPFQITQTSSFTYNLGSGMPRRWGDYSQTVVDPTDNQTFWTFQEYTSDQNVWGVRVIQLKAPPPAVPAEASPNTVPVDSNPHTVQITGIPTDGAGFFDPIDPGPPYPDYQHISAEVSNGVVVNSVSLPDPMDPTQLTLDLDTSAATPGFASITITNPDGQSATCSNALIVESDSTPPATPNPQGTSPQSPANDNNPTVFGSDADCGSQVSLYANDQCTGPPLVTGTATAFVSRGIPVSVSDGSSTDFYAKATSVANVDSACSATQATYVEDSTPPTVSVDSGPTGTISDQKPTFTFSGSDAVGPVTFQCSIDTGSPSFRACSGPGESDTPASPLANGSYTFRVQATDAAGNSAVAARSFAIQIPQPPPPPSPPETTIKGPKKTRKARPKFKFTSTDPNATFQCKLDKRKFKPCTSPFRTPKLRPGKHKLKVRAVGAGGTDASPAVRKFRVLPPK